MTDHGDGVVIGGGSGTGSIEGGSEPASSDVVCTSPLPIGETSFTVTSRIRSLDGGDPNSENDTAEASITVLLPPPLLIIDPTPIDQPALLPVIDGGTALESEDHSDEAQSGNSPLPSNPGGGGSLSLLNLALLLSLVLIARCVGYRGRNSTRKA